MYVCGILRLHVFAEAHEVGTYGTKRWGRLAWPHGGTWLQLVLACMYVTTVCVSIIILTVVRRLGLAYCDANVDGINRHRGTSPMY